MRLPELPTFEAAWWPVWLETVPGSGERIHVAVIVQPMNTKGTQVRQLISPPTLRAMFGLAGNGLQVVVGETVLAIQQQLDAGIKPDQLDMPFGGQGLGKARECLAHDLEEVFSVATRMAGAFGISQFGAVEAPKAESRKAFDEWATKVRTQVLGAAWHEALQDNFDIPVTVTSRKKLRIGFVYGTYVAQFGVLRPGKSVTADVRALKLKLFDLDTLRREQLLPFNRAEVLVGYQDAGDNHTKTQQQSLRDSWQFIEQEAKARKVVTVRCPTAAFAAEHLHQMALAA